jgi:hypothetical protein
MYRSTVRKIIVLLIALLLVVSFVFINNAAMVMADENNWPPDPYAYVGTDIVTDDNKQLQPDTLVVGGFYKMRIYIENNFKAYCMSTGYRIWSDDGALWQYVAQDEGFGSVYSCVTVNPNGRMWPPQDIWDAEKSLFVIEHSMDLVSDDTLIMAGWAVVNGLPGGSLEHMISFHFRVTGPVTSGTVSTLCIDSAYFPPAGAFVFCNNEDVIDPEWGGPICLPVKGLCGNVNGDLNVDVGDAIYMLNAIFKYGIELLPLELCDVNCSGAVDVGDAVYLLNYIFKFGPEPCCQ